MLIFAADLSAEGWVLVIGAIFFGLQKTASMVLDFYRERDQRARDEELKEVVVTTVSQNQDLATKLEEVHEATNGLTKKLMEVTKDEATASALLKERGEVASKVEKEKESK